MPWGFDPTTTRCVTQTSHRDYSRLCQHRAQRTKLCNTIEMAVTISGHQDTTPPSLVERARDCAAPSGSMHDQIVRRQTPPSENRRNRVVFQVDRKKQLYISKAILIDARFCLPAMGVFSPFFEKHGLLARPSIFPPKMRVLCQKTRQRRPLTWSLRRDVVYN